MISKHRLNFQLVALELRLLSRKAQVTFMYTMVQQLTPGVLRTLVRYALQRIDKMNRESQFSHKSQTYAQAIKQRDGSWLLPPDFGIEPNFPVPGDTDAPYDQDHYARGGFPKGDLRERTTPSHH